MMPCIPGRALDTPPPITRNPLSSLRPAPCVVLREPSASFTQQSHVNLDDLLPTLCLEVLRHLGTRNLEATYQRALKIELEEHGFIVEEEVEIKLLYKGRRVGSRRADLVLRRGGCGDEESMIAAVIELKAVSTLRSEHKRQLEFYLEQFGCPTGYLINFPHDSSFPSIEAGRSFDTKVLLGRDDAVDRSSRNRASAVGREPQIVKLSERLAATSVASTAPPFPLTAAEPAAAEPLFSVTFRAGDQGGGGSSAATADTMGTALLQRSYGDGRWPALTQKGTPCKKYSRNENGVFCTEPTHHA